MIFIIQKYPYELSVWTERLNDSGIKEEFFGAIIGSNNMTFLGRATNVKLERDFKGTNTLTFQLPSKYFDSEKGDYVPNEFSSLILNETKIKLLFKDEWFEFYVKKIQEDKKFKSIMYNYTCEDAFIDELSRTGYEIEFDDELNNSVEEVGIFMEEILDGSIWDYTPEHNTGDFTEYNEQAFYRIPLDQFGGSIQGYPIDLNVTRQMFLDEEGDPKEYLSKELSSAGKDWELMSEREQNSFIDNLITISNVFTGEERNIELGDDLAREREVFWDNYYKDNGKELLDEDNKVTLTGRYIYVPITDLSLIMGTIYEDAYSATEEAAIYGSYQDKDKKGYALQPTSQNPRDLVQFIFLKNGDVYHIDDDYVLTDNDFHYVIPIEDWSAALSNQLKGEKCCLYWKQTVPDTEELKITTKYEIVVEDNTAYTINATPTSSTIDNFLWFPVYYDGYLEDLNGTEVSYARKISVTDRTEYNEESDEYVTIYNNTSDEYIIDKKEKTSLYTDEDLEDVIFRTTPYKTGDLEYRVCSKINTRQILPTLSRNLIDNGEKFTDATGWETRIQNINDEEVEGTGSYKSLLSIKIQSTITSNSLNSMIQADITAEDYDFIGSPEEEEIHDYFLEITSPHINNCTDFSKEGSIETDYALNFGFISQEVQIEKDKVYAIQIQTGQMLITGLTFLWRNSSTSELPVVIIGEEGTKTSKVGYDYYTNDDKGYNTEELEVFKSQYENTFDNYKKMFQIFSSQNLEDAIEKGNSLLDNFGTNSSSEIQWFYTLIDRFPTSDDSFKDEKISLIDESLTYLLFGTGGETISAFWKNEKTYQANGSIVEQESVKLNGLINNYDNLVSGEPWEHFNQICLKEDIKFLKYYFLRHLSSYQSNLIKYTSTETVSELISSQIVKEWKEEYILIDSELKKEINKDLDKIVIGQGSQTLEGNYSVEGIDKGDQYFNFEDIYEEDRKIFNVPFYEENSSMILQDTQYHVKENNKWKWQLKKPESDSIYVEDNSFFIFKANQEISNPYIAIRLDSQPMEIYFDYIEMTEYGYDGNNGVQINIKTSSGECLEDVYVWLLPILKTTVTEDIWGNSSLGYDVDYTRNWNWDLSEVPFTWKEEYIKSLNNCWTGTFSALNPLYCSSFSLNLDEDHTIPYLLLVGDKNTLAGIIYLDKEV